METTKCGMRKIKLILNETQVPCPTASRRRGFPYAVRSSTIVGLFCFMITVYVLLSLKDGLHYVGMAKNAMTRLKEHNDGKTYLPNPKRIMVTIPGDHEAELKAKFKKIVDKYKVKK